MRKEATAVSQNDIFACCSLSKQCFNFAIVYHSLKGGGWDWERWGYNYNFYVLYEINYPLIKNRPEIIISLGKCLCKYKAPGHWGSAQFSCCVILASRFAQWEGNLRWQFYIINLYTVIL